MICPNEDRLNTYLTGGLADHEAHVIAQHLAECDTCPALLEVEGSRIPFAGVAIPGRVLGPGDQVGDYVLLHRVGAGGMGVVWAAYDPVLDRQLAIKLLGEHTHSVPELRERFSREARITARLQHPSIVHIQETGVCTNGEPFYVMKLVTGEALEDVIAGKPSFAERLALVPNVSAVTEAIAYAHGQGIIHRDLKPRNVIVGAYGETVVIDWGLASSTADTGGGVMGTPSYMAPEQAAGAAVDERADVYALGAILYHVLAGARPYAGVPASATVAAVLDDPPAPLATLAPGTPPELLTIANKAMARAPADRYPTAKQLADDLGRFLAGQLVGSHRYSRRELVRRWTRRHWTAISAVLVLALAALAVFGLSRDTTVRDTRCEGMEHKLVGVWDPARSEAIRTAFAGTGQPYAAATFERVARRLDEYTRAWTANRVGACEATQRGEQSAALLDLRMHCLDRRLSELDQLLLALQTKPDRQTLERAVESTSSLASIDGCADTDALLAAVPPPRDPAAAARVALLERRLDKAVALERLGRYREGLAELSGVAEQAAAIPYAPLEARVRYRVAQIYRQAGDFPRSEHAARLAIDAGARAKDDETIADAWLEILVALGSQPGRDAAAMEPFVRAAITRAGDTPFHRSRFFNALALRSYKQMDLKTARSYYEQSLALGDRNDPKHRVTLVNLASLSTLEGKHDVAQKAFEELLVLQERDLGGEHPETARVLYQLCSVSLNLGDLETAKRYCERALAVREGSLGDDDPRTADALELLGAVLGRLRDPRAESYFRRGLAIKEKALGPEHPEVGRMLGNLADQLKLLGKPKDAIVLLQRALAIKINANGPAHATNAYTLMALGVALVDDNQPAAGRVHLQEALDSFTRSLGESHPNLAYVLVGLARADLALGDDKRALAEAQRAFEIRKADKDPAARAEVAFLLAKVLKTGDRAITLAQTARDLYAGAGASGSVELAQVDSWLRTAGRAQAQ
ncbi:MAG: serine/threonine protein kinase [Deltaproteobacteria bacterium]|nr:serine/threonine protein kinase [Deltaproteobacteria bacterium]